MSGRRPARRPAAGQDPPSAAGPPRPGPGPGPGPAADDFRAGLQPVVAAWFARTFARPTEAQERCLPAIRQGRSVLLTAPTGSGKTLAGFLGIIDHLVREASLSPAPAGAGAGAGAGARPAARAKRPGARDGRPGGVRAVYVSPLRALTYDIQKNLAGPLREMGLEDDVRVGLRTGDTPARDRAEQRRKPPHLLLTTPESLAILLSQPAWHPALARVRYVVVDEWHALAESKRGVHLALSLERLERLLAPPGPPEQTGPDPGPGPGPGPGPRLCRVGLSATIGEPGTMARLLVGRQADGTPRPCAVVAVSDPERRARVTVFSPVRREPYPATGQAAGRVRAEVAGLIRRERATLVFANTRSGAERFGLTLKEALPELADQIEVHHGSLDRDVRLSVEDRLKEGQLRAVVCSTSLEMGVDVGSIDLVVQLGAPKSVARTVQRVGRSGHRVGAQSRGVLVATNVDELIECAVTVGLVREGRLDAVRSPENCADVLAQHVVGLAMAEPGMRVDEAFALVRRAEAYRRLPREEFDQVVDYLEGGGRSLRRQYAEEFGKIVRRPVEPGPGEEDGTGEAPLGLFTVSRRVERDYLVNVGVIVDAGAVDVFLRRRRLGTVDESFAQELTAGDVFVLGGQSVRFVDGDARGVNVEPAPGETPTVPAWSSARRTLGSSLAAEVSRLRARLAAGEDAPRPGTATTTTTTTASTTTATATTTGTAAAAAVPVPRTDWLVEEYGLSLANAQAIVAYFDLQARVSVVPHEGRVVVEVFREPGTDPGIGGRRLGRPPRCHHFFHCVVGRAANEALARIAAWRVNRLAGGNAQVSANDYGFLLTLQPFQELPLARWREEVFAPAEAGSALAGALREGELVRWQFRAVAQSGLLVPRRYPGQERSRRHLRFSGELLYRVLTQHEPDHPLLREAYRQAADHCLDGPGALAFLERVRAEAWEWRLVEVGAVSPFGFSLFADRSKENLTLEDADAVLERLYQQFYGTGPAAAG